MNEETAKLPSPLLTVLTLHPPPVLPFQSSPSQVGIHHCSGGHLYSDSFVNVNYCSLSGVLSAQGEVCLQGPWPLPAAAERRAPRIPAL